MFAGVHVVLYALFQTGEQIDPGAMRDQVAYCLEKGCDGITVLGLATEVLKLTSAERREMVEIVAPVVHGQRPFSVTIAGNSVAEQAEMARIAEANGADWLILQPPMSGSYPTDVYLDFFARVAAGTNLPVAIQNAPQYLGRGLCAGDIAQLRDRCSNLAAIKAEDSASDLARLSDTVGGALAILGGRGGQELIECLESGATGFVLAPEIAPVACRVLTLWKSGRTKDARTLFDAASAAIDFNMRSLEHLIAYGKRSYAEQAGGLVIHDRAPSLPADTADIETMQRHAHDLLKLARIAP